MGNFRGLLGNSSILDTEMAEKQINPLLIKNEYVDIAFKLARDMMVFTNRRIILVDKQGVTGQKVNDHTLPFKSISHFSVEAEGNFNLTELKVWIAGSSEPVISKSFSNGQNLHAVQQVLASVCL